MISANQIRPGTPVVCSKDQQFAVVDHMEGADCIKLNKDKDGQHHYIPISWVKRVDRAVHIDRPGTQAMLDWSTSPLVSTSAETTAQAAKEKGPVKELKSKLPVADLKEMNKKVAAEKPVQQLSKNKAPTKIERHSPPSQTSSL